jgi:hypothetical protein
VSKPAGVAVGVLWGVVVEVLPRFRGSCCGVSGRPLERVGVVGDTPVRESTAGGLGGVPE